MKFTIKKAVLILLSILSFSVQSFAQDVQLEKYKTEVQISLDHIQFIQDQLEKAKNERQNIYTVLILTGVVATAGLVSLIQRYPNEIARFKNQLDISDVKGMYRTDAILTGTTSVGFFTSYYMLKINKKEIAHFEAEIAQAQKHLKILQKEMQVL